MTHPLPQLTLAEAKEFQFRLVDLMHRHFTGSEVLEAGDYGAPADLGRPRATAKVERVLAEFFGAEDAVLVPGAGTGAIRAALMAALDPGSTVVTHDAPMYATTSVTLRAMGIDRRPVDFNDRGSRMSAVREADPAMVYLQHARHLLDDSYDTAQVIAEVREAAPNAVVMVDDNYTAMQVPRIGVELGADLSAFSLFKLLGEPGVGCVVGADRVLQRIRDDAYSGGSKIQGPVALATLKAVVQAPVMFAVASEVVDEVVERINTVGVPGVRRAFHGNHQERAVLVELDEPIARRVVEAGGASGAAAYPVGSQSRFETNVLLYRLSRAMCEADPEAAERMVRVSPFRSGPETVLRVLEEAVAAVGSSD
jgi:hypothetical protein